MPRSPGTRRVRLPAVNPAAPGRLTGRDEAVNLGANNLAAKGANNLAAKERPADRARAATVGGQAGRGRPRAALSFPCRLASPPDEYPPQVLSRRYLVIA